VSLFRADFDAISESDLLELVDGKVPEDHRLDYKRDIYGPSDKDKKELLKDVSAFANVNGGYIVIGIDEAAGVAAQICGVKPSDIGSEVLRMEQILSSGIEPRIPGLKIRSLQLTSGSHAIVIKVPKSWRAPHRVSFDKWHKFWMRNSAGAHEASMEELRHMFTLSSSAVDRARAFRDDRIALFGQGDELRPLIGSGRFILHIFPLSVISTTVTIDPEKIYAGHASFAPLGSMSLSPRYNLDGVINERGNEANYGYTQIFRNGIVEATKANLVRENGHGRNSIWAPNLEEHIFNALPNYINGLRSLDVQPPLVLMLTLEGVAGAFYLVKNDTYFDELQSFDRAIIRLPECIVEEYSANIVDYHRAVKPAFDALWNAIGFPKCLFFDETTGRWRGP